MEENILITASRELISQLDTIAKNGSSDQRRAAAIAQEALLALRDAVKRPDGHAFRHRMDMIRGLLDEPGA